MYLFFLLCNIDISVGQSFTLFPILFVLYLSLIFYILEKQLKFLKIPIFILFFIDDELFISQHKFVSISNANLFCSYNIISILFINFELIVKYEKTKIFYFSRF